MDDLARFGDAVLRYGPSWGLFLTMLALVARYSAPLMEQLNNRLRITGERRALDKESDWNRLRAEVDRYSGRIERLEASEERCRRELGDALGRLATVEGYMHGRGKADAEAQQIVSLERLRRDKGGETK